MAKVSSLITLQGTFDNITFVKSARYGDHIRAKRGTHKKAVLNDACKKQNRRLVKSNIPAKIIKDALTPYCRDFRDGSMWSRLVSMTNEQYRHNGAFDFAKLKPFEIHKAYPLDRLLTMETKTVVDSKTSELQVSLSFDTHPMFEKSLSVDGYRFRVIGIFPDLKKRRAKTEALYSGITAIRGKIMPVDVQIPVPSKAEVFLICVRIDGCKKGKEYDTLASIGMRMVEAGRI